MLILPIHHNNRTAIAFDLSITLFQRLSSAVISMISSSNYIHLSYMKSTDSRHFIKRITSIPHSRCHFNAYTSATPIVRSNGSRFNGIRCCLLLLIRSICLLLNISDSVTPSIIVFVRLHHNHPLIVFYNLLGRRHVRVVVHHLQLANNVLRSRLRGSTTIRMLIFMKLHINHL